MKPRRNEEAQAHIGLSSHRKLNIYIGQYIYAKVEYPVRFLWNFLFGTVDGSDIRRTETARMLKLRDDKVDITGLCYSNCPTYSNINILTVISIGAVINVLRNQPVMHIVLFEILMGDYRTGFVIRGQTLL
jgi:hypothetical protein